MFNLYKGATVSSLISIILSTTILFYSAVTIAAKIDIPNTISVLKVDNEPQTFSFFTRATSVELTEGQHVLLLQYKELFENDDEDDHVTIKSEPFVLLLETEVNSSYVLTHEKFIELEYAREFAKNPQVNIINQHKEKIEIFTQNLIDFEARAIFNSMDNKLIEVEEATKATSLQVINNKVIENTQAYEMLKYWWQEASQKQKNKFIDDINATQ